MARDTQQLKAYKERERCLALVRAYRERIENATSRLNPVKRQFRDVFECAETVTASLKRIEREIANPGKPPEGDFSLEEMARAEQLIAEQQHNPFEEV